MKVKKRTKSSRFRGSHTHGRGFKKKARGSGHRGGVGMAGTGKRADQKKTLILNLKEEYFGKSKTLRKPIVIKRKVINLSQISENMASLLKKGDAKESKGTYEINLSEYKILSGGEIKFKAKISAAAASSSSLEKVKKAGGEIIILGRKKNLDKKESKGE